MHIPNKTPRSVEQMLEAARKLLRNEKPSDISDAEMKRFAGDPDVVNEQKSAEPLPADQVTPPAAIGATSVGSRFAFGFRDS